ncbi:hypothetical protein TIFTF001_003445 [Ficus carica]|uniref:Cysteine-rich receptor-like protein kinase n=1 Tax=Ficus carica TaxID=3494 RepID=A0AA88CVH0_FICCA|nr:hypothetical protein TIFTF001_003445 [Ficus carica]
MYASHAFGRHVGRTTQPRKERTWKGAYSHRIAFLCMVTLASAQPSFLYEYCRNDNQNYTTNITTYQLNSNHLSRTLIAARDSNGAKLFYNFSDGQFSDYVFESGLCRGDIEPDVCRSCLNHSTHLLAQICPNKKEAIGGFDECMLRFSNPSAFGLMETHPRFYLWNTQEVASDYVNSFFRQLRTLLDDLKSRASAGGSLRKYATGTIGIGTAGFQTIYALVQCMPDLSQSDCKNCLDDAFGDIPRNSARVGGRVVTPSCNFRYEVYLFYGHAVFDASLAAPPSPPPLLQTNTAATQVFVGVEEREFLVLEGKKRNKFETGFVVVPIVLIIFIGIYSRVKKANNMVENLPSSEAAEEIECAKCLRFDFGAIRFATGNFSNENKIGRSMVGLVYRGKLRDGQNISVKRICEHDSYRDYFKNEVKISSKLQHRNLVKLLGFCLERSERFLVYEFVPMSLDLLIFDPLKFKHIYLDWDKRSNIIRGIARGLLYLHEDSGLKIVHRDITASNVLLDEELNPKILGFGRAKVFGEVDQNEVASVSQNATTSLTGYGAPEFFQGGVISEKADVFSFGVLVLEIVTGQRSCEPLCHGNPDEEPTLICTVWRNWIEGTVFDLVDPKIKDGKESEIMRCIHIGLLCVQENKDARPTMNSVVLMLCCYSFPLPVPSQPGYFGEISRNELNGPSSSDLNSGALPNESFQWFLQESSCLFASYLFLSVKYSSQFGKAFTEDQGHGFFTASHGRNISEEVYGTGLCLGDVEPQAYRSCLDQSTQLLTKTCPNQKEAIGGFDECMLRYSNRSLIGVMETHPRFYSWNTQNCTPDISWFECANCLDETFGDIQRYYGRVGGRVVAPSCKFRYEVYSFYGKAREAPPALTPANPPPSLTNTTTTQDRPTSAAAAEVLGFADCLQFQYDTITAATNNFSEANKIGKDTNGAPVYKGRLLSGQKILVKRFFRRGLQSREHFKTAILLAAKLQHRNLVSLLGFFLMGNEGSLVYEFLPMSLTQLISADPLKANKAYLDWDVRYNIICGIARGLLYLYEDCRMRIIHRNLGPNKFFLDEEMNPKISGFESEKLVGVDQSENTSGQILETFGYIAPETLIRRLISVKSNVFSFGVLLLKIVTGQSNMPSCDGKGELVEPIASKVWRNWRDGMALNLIDPKINGGSTDKILRCIHVGLLCVQENEDARPTMNSVLHMLSCNSLSPPAPSPPPCGQGKRRWRVIRRLLIASVHLCTKRMRAE